MGYDHSSARDAETGFHAVQTMVDIKAKISGMETVFVSLQLTKLFFSEP
jgi:hypothetical protein